VKILKANHPNLVGRLAEIRAFYKTSLFVLVKDDLKYKQTLKHSNGFLAINNLCVVVPSSDTFHQRNDAGSVAAGP